MTFRRSTRPPDPKPVGEILQGLAQQPGWADRLAFGRLAERWVEVAGAVVAEHSQPLRIEEGTLLIRADSGVWATELSLLGKALAARAAAVLGPGSVASVRVVSDPGPKRAGGPWKRAGQKGSRGASGHGKKGL